MQKDVSIQIKGSQKYPEGHENHQDLLVAGKFYKRNGVYYILYKEMGNAAENLGEMTTFLTIKQDAVLLYRKGAVNLSQEFVEGVLHSSLYNTCHGDIRLSVLPRLVESDLTVTGGRISLEYDLFVDDKLVSYNGLLLNVKEDIPQ